MPDTGVGLSKPCGDTVASLNYPFRQAKVPTTTAW